MGAVLRGGLTAGPLLPMASQPSLISAPLPAAKVATQVGGTQIVSPAGEG